MKKILGLTISALLVMGLVGGGTWAYFSDPETSYNNVLTAGTLDLEIGGGNTNVQILDVSATYPGDSDSGNTTLVNVGSIAGSLDITFVKVDDIGGSGGTEFENNPGAGNGDLDAEATIAIWVDVDEDDTFSDGDILLTSTGSGDNQTRAGGSPATPTKYSIDSFDGDSWTDIVTLDATGGANDGVKFFIDYLIPTTATNAIQGDSVSANMTFTLGQ